MLGLLNSLMLAAARCHVVLLAFLAATAGAAEVITPAATVSLQCSDPTHLNSRDSKIIATSDAIYVLIEGRKGAWTFDKITGVDTAVPVQRSLRIAGFTRDKADYWNGFFVTDLILTPNERYAIIRTSRRTESFGNREHTQTDFTAVDLSKFTITATSSSSDPTFSGFLRVLDDDLMIAESIGREIRKDRNSFTSESTAAAVAIPSLKPSLECNIRQTVKNYRTPSISSETDENTCSDLLKVVGVDKPTKLMFPEAVKQSVPFHMDNCAFKMETADERLALFRCATGHVTWYDTDIIRSQAIKVVSVPKLKPIIYLPLGRKEQVASSLGTVEGHRMLLVVRGSKLEVYEPPDN